MIENQNHVKMLTLHRKNSQSGGYPHPYSGKSQQNIIDLSPPDIDDYVSPYRDEYVSELEKRERIMEQNRRS